jgi:hypothetical protein
MLSFAWLVRLGRTAAA